MCIQFHLVFGFANVTRYTASHHTHTRWIEREERAVCVLDGVVVVVVVVSSVAGECRRIGLHFLNRLNILF